MSDPRPDRVRVSGPLASFAEGFGAELVGRGYALRSVQSQLELLAQLSRWMGGEGLDVGDLSPLAVRRFLTERRHRYASEMSEKRLCPLLDYLDGLGVLQAGEQVELTAVDRLLEDFRRYLFEERGLVSGSVDQRVRAARVAAGQAAHGRDGGVRAAGAVAVPARAGLGDGAAGRGGAVRATTTGGSATGSPGVPGEALAGCLRPLDDRRAPGLRHLDAGCPAGAALR